MRSAVFVLVVALGCGKSGSSTSSATGSAAAPAAATPSAPAASGPLTVERVMSAGSLYKPMAPWDEALGKLEAALGPPTRIKGGAYEWAAMEGDTCALVTVGNINGKAGGAFPAKLGPDGPTANRTECLDVVKSAAH